MTGPSAASGASLVAAVNAAIREINLAGGVLGADVRVTNRDAAQGDEAFDELVASGVDVVIGPDAAHLAQLLLPRATAVGIPLISPSVTATIPDAEGFFARTIPTAVAEAPQLAESLDDAGASRIALLVGADPTSTALAVPLGDALAGHDAQLVTTIPVASTSAVALARERIAELTPDAVVLATPAGEVTEAMLGELAAAGITGENLWLTSATLADYSALLPEVALVGATGLREGAPSDDAFATRLRFEDPGATISRYAAEAYDATMIAALAAVFAGDDGGASIAWRVADVTRDGIPCTSFGACLDVLRTEPAIAYAGTVGVLELDDSGDPTRGAFTVFRYDDENRPQAVASAVP